MYQTDTYKLLDILKKYKNFNYSYDILNQPFFNKLYSNWKSILEKCHDNISLNITSLNSSPTSYFKDSNFTSHEIKTDILSKLKNGYKIQFENNEIIYFTNKKKVSNLINKIAQIIKSLKILFHREKIDQKLFFFESSMKKMFPSKNKILGSNECNSGVTFITFEHHKNGEITLYRKEEILKVLIHELIHSNLIDSHIILSKDSKKINEHFCVKYNILLNETVTETIATILNLFYIGIMNKMTPAKINNLFKNEIKYSIYVCSKIMNYYKFEDTSIFSKKYNECKTYFPQETNVIAYYLFKPIIFLNYMAYGSLLEKYSLNYKINNEAFIPKMIDLVINNLDLLKKDKYLYVIKKDDKNKSLRMTLYEFYY
jgi:hypothetical protein